MATLPCRRRLAFSRVGNATVHGTLEDHVHHFEVEVSAADGRVASIDGRAVRAPWSLCPGAAGRLGELVGAPVGVLPRPADPAQHCTHLLDVAATAVRFAGLALDARRYDATVDAWDTPMARARLERDDGAALEWEVHRTTIASPPPYEGRSIGAGFAAWVDATLDDDHAEMALILRRATWMSMVRGIDLDTYERLSELPISPGSCYATQPERIHVAMRNRGSSLEALDR